MSCAFLVLATACGGGGGGGSSSPAATTSAPSITTQPGPASASVGGNASFTVAATGAGLTYQWQVSSDGVTFSNLSDGGVYSGTATATLTITGATAAMNGYSFDCVVGGSVSPAATSAAVVLKVTAPITTQPIATSASAGGSATFKVAATGAGLTYQWQVSTDGVTFTNLTDDAVYGGSATATLIISNPTQAMNGYKYDCVVSGPGLSPVTSAAATLTVNPAGAPAITSQPAAASASVGGYASFSVAASGTSLTYQWQVSTDGVTFTSLTDGGVYAGSTAPTLTITGPTLGMSGYSYDCVVTGSIAPPATSTAAVLTVTALAGAPAITTQPGNQTVTTGTAASFTVVASGSNLIYQWQVSATSGGTYTSVAGNGYTGATTDTLGITSAAPALSGSYYECIVTGTTGAPVTTTPALLTVVALPTITSFTTDQWSVPAGGQVTFTAGFSNGSDVGRSAVITPGPIDISSGTATATPSASTTYTLVVKNSAGTSAATSPTLRIVAGSLANVAGTPGGYGEIDGSGNLARFSFPAGMVYDASRSSLYVVDQGYNGTLGGTVRVLSALGTRAGASTVGTFAGVAGMDLSHVPNDSSKPLLNAPYAVAADGFGNLFVADTNNACIRMIDSTGKITTVAGTPANTGDSVGDNGNGTFGQFRQPYGVAVHMTSAATGSLYIADSGNNKIKVTTLAGGTATGMSVLAGTGAADYSNGTGVSGADVAFNYPIGISVNAANTYLYVADADNDSIRSIDTVTGATTTPVHGGLVDPLDVLDVTIGITEYVIVTDTGNNQIHAFHTDGTSAAVLSGGFVNPTHVASNGTDLFVSDSGNNAIRRILAPFGSPTVVTLAGLVGNPGRHDDTGTSASFSNPGNLAVDASGLVYVADRANSLIRTVNSGGTTTLYAGTPGSVGHVDDTRLASTFTYPQGVGVDTHGNVYVADSGNHCVRIIDTTGTVATIADHATLALQNLVSIPVAVVSGGDGVLYVADSGIPAVLKLTTTDTTPTAASIWTTTILAGQYGLQGWADGAGLTAAMFYTPGGIAFDAVNQIVYVADAGNNNIRAIAADGTVTTLAGDQESKPQAGSVDDTGAPARFNNPQAVAYDAGYLYVADTNNGTVRRIDTATGTVHTIVGLFTRTLQDTLGYLPAAVVAQGIAVDHAHGLVYLSTNDAILSFPF